ncbi:MAG TPA: MBL fold metallo-hydrolase [Spirochaetota bacterium]|nr:MBL fold metallo-hydrolase [Spirochaetota bacterium]HPI22054.1 MBL fold metallo-hydrolase [Spirochaetota bacterium]HPU88169.1 MBL fold metallo-hydrolase [Spirochaetota bacterium]
MGNDTHPITVKFWGTRGSIPTPGKYFVKYGGNTPCVEVRCGDTILIFDAGTGMRELGASLLHEFAGSPREYHILISHTHWDHIQGFPFFHVAYLPGNKVTFYGGNSVSALENLIFGQMDREYFPVTLFELSAEVTFKTLVESPFAINDVKLYFTHQIHPALSLGFRIEYRGRVVVYATDSEISNDPEIERINERNIGSLIKDADILIADCQYTAEEYQAKVGWGHTSIDKAVEMSNRYGVRNLFAFHHDPLRTDEQLDIMIDNARNLVKPPLRLHCAREKTTVRV